MPGNASVQCRGRIGLIRSAHHGHAVQRISATREFSRTFTNGPSLREPGLRMSPRPFRVLGVQQIALGALSKEPLLDFWSGLLGLPVRGAFESASENVQEAILELGVG